MLTGRLEPGLAVGRLQDAIVRPEVVPQQLTHVRVVLHDQHDGLIRLDGGLRLGALSVDVNQQGSRFQLRSTVLDPGSLRHRRFLRHSRVGVHAERKPDDEGTAKAQLTLDAQGAPVQLHQLACQRQAQPHPLVRPRRTPVDLLEAVEDALQRRFWNARAGVFDDHLDRLIACLVARVHRHPDFAALGRELERVGEQV